jgi:hypothetical protein
MEIRNQKWQEEEKYILIHLLEPYWSAYKKYNWDHGVEGFGISQEAINYAIKSKKHIRVNVSKYGIYDINPTRLEKEALERRIYYPRDHKPLFVLPRNAFDRINEEIKEVKVEKPQNIQESLL